MGDKVIYGAIAGAATALVLNMGGCVYFGNKEMPQPRRQEQVLLRASQTAYHSIKPGNDLDKKIEEYQQRERELILYRAEHSQALKEQEKKEEIVMLRYLGVVASPIFIGIGVGFYLNRKRT